MFSAHFNQARTAADVADAFCDGEIRLTVDQKLLFPNVDTAKVSEMTKMPFFQKFPVVRAEVARSFRLIRCVLHAVERRISA